MAEVNMPRLSDTMQEGTIARWLKKQGDAVTKGEVIAEIETDKATMDLESYSAGTLEKILVQEGETVPIGQAIALIGSGSGAQKQEQPADAKADVAATPASPPQPDRSQQAQEAQPTTPTAPDQASAAQAGPQQGSNGTDIKVSPLARRMAEEYGLDLRQIHGKGPRGRIERDDIEEFREQQSQRAGAPQAPQADQPAAAAVQEPTPAAQEEPAPARPQAAPAAPPEVVKLSRMQAAIARRLTESKQTIPHFYVRNEVNMTEALALRQTLNASAGENGVKVSVNDLIVKAAALALEKFPEVNSSLKDGQFVRHKQINVGVAVDVPSGLVVPVIRDANIKGVRSIARETKALIEKARANKLSQSDLEGGTFSVSNLGMMDVSDFIAVINPPEAAILAVASTRKQYVPVDGQPVIQDLMPLTLSADHRILYGAAVARFLQEVKRLLEKPYNLLG